RQEVFEVANNLNIETKTKLAKPEDLIGREVWLMSSLQGIRPVTEWIGLSKEFKAGERKDLFDQELLKFVAPLP
ncbi:MAG: aminotransferase class IV, partial [Microbacteriaceae bacterium]|nr:aminotransferase class IV [Microbacteriaceae bacterium]